MRALGLGFVLFALGNAAGCVMGGELKGSDNLPFYTEDPTTIADASRAAVDATVPQNAADAARADAAADATPDAASDGGTDAATDGGIDAAATDASRDAATDG